MELAFGNLDAACRFAGRAQEHAEELTSPWHIGFPIALLGMVALQEGDAELATERLEASRALWEEVGDPRGLLFAYTNLGAATLALGRSDEALVSLGNALLAGDTAGQARAVFLEALATAAQVQAVATGLGAPVGLARVAAEEDGEQAGALAAYTAAHPQANEAVRAAAQPLAGDGSAGPFAGAPFAKVARALLEEAGR